MRTIEDKDTIEYLFSDFEHNNIKLILKAEGYVAIDCEECDGSGNIECLQCEGHGSEECSVCDGTNRADCQNCNGSGNVDCDSCDCSGEDEVGDPCEECAGDGTIPCGDCNGEGMDACGECRDGRIDCDECDSGNNECEKCCGKGCISPSTGSYEIDFHKDLLASVKWVFSLSFFWQDMSLRIINKLKKLSQKQYEMDSSQTLTRDEMPKLKELISSLSDDNISPSDLDVINNLCNIITRLDKRISLYPDITFRIKFKNYYSKLQLLVWIYDVNTSPYDLAIYRTISSSDGLDYTESIR